eukprot:1012730-Amphidinium_carterae.1
MQLTSSVRGCKPHEMTFKTSKREYTTSQVQHKNRHTKPFKRVCEQDAPSGQGCHLDSWRLPLRNGHFR